MEKINIYEENQLETTKWEYIGILDEQTDNKIPEDVFNRLLKGHTYLIEKCKDNEDYMSVSGVFANKNNIIKQVKYLSKPKNKLKIHLSLVKRLEWKVR